MYLMSLIFQELLERQGKKHDNKEEVKEEKNGKRLRYHWIIRLYIFSHRFKPLGQKHIILIIIMITIICIYVVC